MRLIKTSLLLVILLSTGCETFRKKEELNPPSVSTYRVIESLETTKEILNEAGNQNTNVGRKIDKAIELAEKLDALLQQIEESNNKNIIK